MDHVAAMGVLQSGCNLADRGDDSSKRQAGTQRVALSHRTRRGIVHDENRCPLLDRKVKYPHNRRMCQAHQDLGFSEELLDALVVQRGEQYFEGRIALEIAMLTEIHFSLTTSTE